MAICLRQCLAVLLSFAFFIPLQVVQAQTVSPGQAAPQPINLDLTSTNPTLSPGRAASTPVPIVIGGTAQNITSTSVLTPAERLAVYQVLSTGQQSIQIGNLGNAIGGSFNMGANFAQYVSSLVIPQGVTAVMNAALS